MDTTEPHPLLLKDFKRLRTWKDWKVLWVQAEYEAQLLTLLHCAFDVECARDDEWEERLRFLLRAADGHATLSTYWPRAADPPGNGWDWDERARRIDERRPLAEKAFLVLCDRYFEARVADAGCRVSPLSGMTPELLQAILWFFDDSGRHACGRNLPRQDDKRHYAKAARAYLRVFVREAWPHGRSRGDRSAETEAALPALRVRYVRLLHDLDDLGFLLEKDRLEEETAQAIRAFVLYDGQGRQVYRDAEEAIVTPAGATLLVLEAKLRQQERKRLQDETEWALKQAQDEYRAARR